MKNDLGGELFFGNPMCKISHYMSKRCRRFIPHFQNNEINRQNNKIVDVCRRHRLVFDQNNLDKLQKKKLIEMRSGVETRIIHRTNRNEGKKPFFILIFEKISLSTSFMGGHFFYFYSIILLFFQLYI